MNLNEFRQSLKENNPPEGLKQTLLSLWYDGKGNWHEAHEIADKIPGANGAWVHAYLHRKEGDNWNADYWYVRAGKTRPDILLIKEWEEIVKYFLGLDT